MIFNRKAEEVGASARRPHILCEAQNVRPPIARREGAKRLSVRHLEGSEDAKHPTQKEIKDKKEYYKVESKCLGNGGQYGDGASVS